jgi:hypothetical protein
MSKQQSISQLIAKLQTIQEKYGDLPLGFKSHDRIKVLKVELKVINPKTNPLLDVNVYGTDNYTDL